MDKEKLFAQIKGGLIVSCQALEHEPLYTKEGGVMPLMAKAAAMSGAVGIRANTVRDITQIKEVVDLPVIGIIKKDYPGTPMYITVTMKEVDELVACGVDILAVQGTGALRPDGSTSAEFIRAIKAKYPDQLVMADCDNFENAMACAEAGADFVGTTMRGYTPETQGIDDIDFDFVHKLATECPAKVIAEGHIHYPEQAVKALEAGAFALVVGGAITRPAEITARFTGAINAMNKQYLAIDIGGTAVKLGIVDETGAVGPKAEESVNFDGYQTPVLTTVLKAAKAFVETQNIDVNTLEGVGVSATGQIDSRKGIVAGTCGNFPNYINSPIQAELERLFGLPVTVANDANCMTLGEVWVGGAKGYTDVIGVTLGTGVGGGILTGGRLLEGARGLGGELGHYRTHALDGVPCTCGATGCWERYAATTALVRAAQKKDPAWKDGRAIFAAAEAGNETVLALLDAWTDEIAQGLAGMVHIFNPQLILIGGGVSAQQKLLIEPIAAKVRASVMPAFAEGLEIRAAQLHNDAGMVGAVYYFRQQHGEA
mgnify:CR=1 FL=1